MAAGAKESREDDSKAPVIGSPSKAKVVSPDKKATKETVKLPSIAPPVASPTKKPAKGEPASAALPSGSTKAITPTSPSKPSSKQPRPGSKTNLAPVKVESERPVEVKPPQEREAAGVDSGSIVPAETQSSAEPDTGVEAEAVAAAAAAVAAEEVAAFARAQEEEAARLRKENSNGMVKLIYEQYDELFPIVDGSTTQANIDDVYCLSFVMPNCLVRLSYHPSAERFERENNGIFDSLVPEDPRGTYQNLVKDQTYYVVVEQEADQLRRDQEATKAKWAPAAKQEKLKKDDGRGFESCSCIYGNPCADEYGCKDWHSRFAVATANGWKGF